MVRLVAPKGTPADIVRKLNDAVVRSLADTDVRQQLTGLGPDVAPPTKRPGGFCGIPQAEIEKWGPIIAAADIKVE